MAPVQGVGASSILARDNNGYYIIFFIYILLLSGQKPKQFTR